MLTLVADDASLNLAAVYAPTQSHAKQQLEFLRVLETKIDEFTLTERNNLIMCGDFNIQLSGLDVDKQNFRPSSSARRLNGLLKKYKFLDVWRHNNPTVRQYSWRRLVPLQQSRIDYFFASKHLLNKHVTRRVDIAPGILSDHSLLSFELQLVEHKKGPGLWRFNNTHLDDESFTDWVRTEIHAAIQKIGIYENVLDTGLLLEMLTSEIRSHSISFGKLKAKQRREGERRMVIELNKCESDMCANPQDENITRKKGRNLQGIF